MKKRQINGGEKKTGESEEKMKVLCYNLGLPCASSVLKYQK